MALALIAILGSGCYSWRSVPLEREAILESDLASKEVRYRTEQGGNSMIVTVVALPPDSEEWPGGFLQGTINGRDVTVRFDTIRSLEVREFSFWGTAGIVGAGIAGAVLLAAVVLGAIVLVVVLLLESS